MYTKIDKIKEELEKLESKEILVDFFRKHKEKINWESLCENKNIPYTFFEENVEKLNKKCWKRLAENSKLPFSFFEKHFDKLEKDVILKLLISNDNLTEEILEKYFDVINWECLCVNEHVPHIFFDNHFDKIDRCGWQSLCKNANIPYTFFEKHIDCEFGINWLYLCSNINIPYPFFEKYFDNIEWVSLCENKNIPCAFFEKYFDKINWKYLCKNVNIPRTFFEKHLDKLDWESLCMNEGLCHTFFEKHIDKIIWSILWLNSNIPFEFYEKYYDSIDISYSFYSSLLGSRPLKEQLFVRYFENVDLYQEMKSIHLGEWKCEGKCKKILQKPKIFETMDFGGRAASSIINLIMEILCKNKSTFVMIEHNIEFLNNMIVIDYAGNLSNGFGLICKNDFSVYIDNRIRELKMMQVFVEIENYVYSVPDGEFSPLPKGGVGYRELCEKY